MHFRYHHSSPVSAGSQTAHSGWSSQCCVIQWSLKISLKCIKQTQMLAGFASYPTSDSGVDVVLLPWTPPQHHPPTANIRVLTLFTVPKMLLVVKHSALLPYYETRLSERPPCWVQTYPAFESGDVYSDFLINALFLRGAIVMLWNVTGRKREKRGEVHSKSDYIDNYSCQSSTVWCCSRWRFDEFYSCLIWTVAARFIFQKKIK